MSRRGAYGAGSGDRRGIVRRDSWFERNPVTVLSVSLATLFLVGTPQVRLILFDLPPVGTLGLSRSGAEAAALWAYFVLLFGAYFSIAWSLLDSRAVEDEAQDTPPPGIRGWPRRWVRRLQRMAVPLLAVLLVQPAERMQRGTRRLLGAGLCLFGMVPVVPNTRVLVGLAPIAQDRVWPQVLGVGLLLVGGWLLLARLATDPGRPRLPREQALWDHGVDLSVVVGRSIELLLVSAAAGELLWWVVDGLVQSLSWRIYTLWGSCQIALYFVIFGRIADAAGRKAWTRLLVGGAGIATLAVLSSAIARVGIDEGDVGASARERMLLGRDRGHDADSDLRQATALTEAWFDRVDARLASMGDEDEPVILVAASGGGSRAALW
jgi:hypothetical protein